MDNNQIQNEITKSNKTIFYILLGVILLLVIVIILMLLNNNKNAASNIDNSNINNDVMPNNNNYEETNNIEEKNDNKTIEQNRINPDSVPLTSNDFTYVTVNGIPIKFPATKDSFSATGWKWDEKYATRKLDSGTTSSGGRIGNYPGGVVVGVVNTSTEVKEIQDCIIDDGTFYNPKDGSNNVVFVGNLTFNSTMEQVKTKMSELRYSYVKETKVGTMTQYKYYKYDDSSNYKDYIEFSFNDGILSDVGIYTSGE